MPYPTDQHRRAAEAAVEIFSAQEGVQAITLICSLARGTATSESDLDLGIVMGPGEKWNSLRKRWEGFYQSTPVFSELAHVGTFTHVDISFTDGCFAPRDRGWLSGPDAFELEIGNFIAYAEPLWQNGPYFQELRETWLPFSDAELRPTRLEKAVKYCRNNLQHIPLYIDRGQHFQSHNRLHLAVQDFLFGLFVARRKYPVAYDKWICDQFINILDLPELYSQVVQLYEIHHLESDELAQKAGALDDMVTAYLTPA